MTATSPSRELIPLRDTATPPTPKQHALALLQAEGVELPLRLPEPPAGKGKHTRGQRQVLARERDRLALALRRGGATYAEISVQVGCSESMACRIVARALARQAARGAETAETVLQLELQRLDALLVVLWGQIEDADSPPLVVHSAIDRVLKIQERRAKYLGLDGLPRPAPTTPDQAARRALLPAIAGATREELVELRAICSKIRNRQEAAGGGRERG